MVEVKEEQKYKRLRRLAQELHLPIPEAFIELEVFDKDGKVIQKHRQRSHSWVRNAYNLLLSEMCGKVLDDSGVFGAGLLSIKDTGGVIRASADAGAVIAPSTGDFEALNAAYRANATVINHGIQVGSDATAWSFEDYNLLAQIAEGTGAGELNAVATDVPTKSWSAPTFTITWIRYFNNNSGGNVLVKEAALCTSGHVGSACKFIMSRDKLASTVTVPDTGQLKVTYTIQLTYPS
ncbi:hypothetical protein ES707_06344 [subsurface metagenome]